MVTSHPVYGQEAEGEAAVEEAAEPAPPQQAPAAVVAEAQAVAEVQVFAVEGAAAGEVVEVFQAVEVQQALINDVQVIEGEVLLEAAPAAVEAVLEVAPVPQAAGIAIRAVAAEAPAEVAEEDLLIAKGAEDWKYFDTGQPVARDWRKADFDDSEWKTGKAPLGYGDNHIATKVSFGDKANDKHLVTFFRRNFEIKDRDAWKNIAGRVLCDDGVAIFVNSRQVFRHNLPNGQLNTKSRARQAKSGRAETAYNDFAIPAVILKEGVNSIAIRVHQVNKTSSDLGFDLELRRVSKEELAKVKAKQKALAAAEVRAIRDAAQARQAVVPPPVAAPRRITRSFIHVSDGQVVYIDQNGERRTQRNDCVQQATSYVPGAAFIRVLEGDTLAKIAAQRDLPADMLAKLNRTTVTKVFDQPNILATRWKHEVQAGETLQHLANGYNTQTRVLLELNPDLFKERKEVKAGDMLTVPGEYTYHYRDSGNSYLRLARYNNNIRRPTPFKAGTQKTRRQKAKEAQSLADFAKEHQVEPEFLAKMNGLKEDAELKKDQWLLLEYSVEVSEGTTAQQLVQYFGIELDLFLEVNEMDDADDLEAGKRVEMPIGNRMNRNRVTPSSQGNDPQQVVSVVLGGAATDDEEGSGEVGNGEASAEQ